MCVSREDSVKIVLRGYMLRGRVHVVLRDSERDVCVGCSVWCCCVVGRCEWCGWWCCCCMLLRVVLRGLRVVCVWFVWFACGVAFITSRIYCVSFSFTPYQASFLMGRWSFWRYFIIDIHKYSIKNIFYWFFPNFFLIFFLIEDRIKWEDYWYSVLYSLLWWILHLCTRRYDFFFTTKENKKINRILCHKKYFSFHNLSYFLLWLQSVQNGRLVFIYSQF